VARMSEQSLEDKLLAAPEAAPKAPALARAPTWAAPPAPPAAPAKVAPSGGFDVPVIPVVGVVAAAFAAATFSMRSGKGDREAEQSSPPAPASSSATPVASSPEPVASSPEPVASSPAPAPSSPEPVASPPAPAPVAKVDATDISVPYDAAARLEYEHSDKSMEYDKFKDKYQADTVAFVKAKQTKKDKQTKKAKKTKKA
jgi:hypothetical protein